MSFLRTLVTYQATQEKFQIVNNSLFSNNWRYSKHTLVETPKHTLETRAGQQVQTRKVTVIEILKLCSHSLTLRLAQDTSTGVTVRERKVFNVCIINRSFSVTNFRIRTGKLVCELLWFGKAVHR